MAAFAIVANVPSPPKNLGKSLDPQANDRIRVAVHELLARPEYGGVQTALAPKLKMSQAGLSSFLSGKTGAGSGLAQRVAVMAGVSLEYLLTGTQRGKRFRDLPGWAEAEAEARKRYRRIPDYAWRGAGGLISFDPPRNIDAAVVLGFAQAWEAAANEDDIERAEMADVEALAQEEDRANAQRPLDLEPPQPPKARKRRKDATPTPSSAVVEKQPGKRSKAG